MRVLHIDSGRGMRGGQWQVARLVEGLAAAGVECTLLARGGGALLETARKNGWRARPLRCLALERGYDLVHAHDSRAHTLAAWLCGAPLVVSRRVAFGGPIATGPKRWKYARAARFIAISEHVKSVLAQRGVPAEKIDVVYDGVPLVSQRTPGETPTRNRVIAPDNFDDPEKGAALAREAARRLGIEIEFSRDLERDLRRAAAFVYITRSEGLGSAVLLAMSAGVPVVASKTGGLPEIVKENGFLVENDADAIAAALGTLLGDPARAERMGAAGRRMVAEQFTMDAMVRRTIEVYRKVLS